MPITIVNVSVKNLRPKYANLTDWLKDENHIYIGNAVQWVEGANANMWVNPFSIESFGLERSLVLYESYILGTPELLEGLPSLQGKSLGCWFDFHPQRGSTQRVPMRCHGDVLKKLVEERIDSDCANTSTYSIQKPSQLVDRKLVSAAKVKYFEDRTKNKSTEDIHDVITSVDPEIQLILYKVLTDIEFDRLSPARQSDYIHP